MLCSPRARRWTYVGGSEFESLVVFPASRGWTGPAVCGAVTAMPPCPPRWGWTDEGLRGFGSRDVFSARVGMDRWRQSPGRCSRGLPRGGGDGPHLGPQPSGTRECSLRRRDEPVTRRYCRQHASVCPARRGWTAAGARPRTGCMFPADAGMDRDRRVSADQGRVVFPASRGWTGSGAAPCSHTLGSPTHVGMDRPRPL